jgi:glutamine synthetase
MATGLEKVPPAKCNSTLQTILHDIIKTHKRVIFNGDNYTAEWTKEAEKRGLPNFRKTAEALDALLSKKAEHLFAKYKVLSKTELHSRYEVYIEEYKKTIVLEGTLALNMVKTIFLPVAIKQQGVIADTVIKLKAIGVTAGSEEQKKKAVVIGDLISDICEACDKMEKSLEAHKTDAILRETENMRKAVDKLEQEVDDHIWPLPKYGEMLFIY